MFSVKSNNFGFLCLPSSILMHGNNVIDNLVKAHLTSCVLFLLNCFGLMSPCILRRHITKLCFVSTWLKFYLLTLLLDLKTLFFVSWMKPGLKTFISLEFFIFQYNKIRMNHSLFPVHVFKLNYTPFCIIMHFFVFKLMYLWSPSYPI